MSKSTSVLDGGETAVARIQEVISQTRAEIERSKKLVKLIREASRRAKPSEWKKKKAK